MQIPRSFGRRVGSLLCLVALHVSGCCAFSASRPDVGKYFNRRTAESALLGFVYSIEVGEWEYAFASLDSESQRLAVSPTRLLLAAHLEEDPDFKVSVRDVLTGSIRFRSVPDSAGPGVQRIELNYTDTPAVEDPIFLISFTAILIREGTEWRVDGFGTLGSNWPELFQAEGLQ